jgi:hypothetical protein
LSSAKKKEVARMGQAMCRSAFLVLPQFLRGATRGHVHATGMLLAENASLVHSSGAPQNLAGAFHHVQTECHAPLGCPDGGDRAGHLGRRLQPTFIAVVTAGIDHHVAVDNRTQPAGIGGQQLTTSP